MTHASRVSLATALLALVAISTSCGRDVPHEPPLTGDSAGWLSHESAAAGVAFRYSPRYFLVERTADAPSITIMLMEDVPDNRDYAAGRSQVAREAPPAITLEIFPRTDSGAPVERWVTDAPDSTFRLSADSELSAVTLAGLPAIGYRWDGLYLGESVAAARGAAVHVWSVTSLGREDAIVADFHAILDTVSFAPTSPGR